MDLTTYDVGRDIRFLEEVSRKSGPAYDRRHGPERRAQNIKRLVDAGFVGKVFLSQDAKFGGSLLGEDAKDFRSKLDPQEGLLFTARTLIPRLRQIGVPDAGIRTMTVGNSRAFFAVP